MFLDTEFLQNDEIKLVLERTQDGDAERNWVPAYHFAICSPDGTRMGVCDLRIGYNDNLYYGGHIGYRIFPEYRGKHYAGKACLLLFQLARKHDMENFRKEMICAMKASLKNVSINLRCKGDRYGTEALEATFWIEGKFRTVTYK